MINPTNSEDWHWSGGGVYWSEGCRVWRIFLVTDPPAITCGVRGGEIRKTQIGYPQFQKVLSFVVGEYASDTFFRMRFCLTRSCHDLPCNTNPRRMQPSSKELRMIFRLRRRN